MPAANFDTQIQALNKRFYGELVDWFRWASSEIHLARLPGDTMDDPAGKNRGLATQQFTVRLICRLLFAWFLKEMRLIPAELLELYDAADRPRILTRDGDDFRHWLAGNHYYRGILQNVFFQALNRPMDQRRKSAYLGQHDLPDDFDYTRFDRIPCLHGGLFDPLPEDNLEFTREEDTAFHVPNKLFHARREDGFTLAAGAGRRGPPRPVEGLNRILARYRFTVAENTLLEEDIALDPELLGLVFENLLAEIDPGDDAAAASARRESGSYYTPRRIVDYMVNEALHLHLRTRFEQAGASRDDLQLLTQLFYGAVEEPADPRKRRRASLHPAEGLAADVDFSPIADRVVMELDAVRVLDPACGSGAFPMGMLHRMVEVLRQVDPANERWKEKLLGRLPPAMRRDAARGMEGQSDDYLRKLGLIQKNLHGLDIQPLAALIAKFRFFLTLVIEQKVDAADAAHNYGLAALPNLETNLFCADALSGNDSDQIIFKTQRRRGAKDAEEERARNCRAPFGERHEIVHRDLCVSASLRFPEIPSIPIASFRLSDAEGAARQPVQFHIVIGNPPYGGADIARDVQSALGLGCRDPYGAFIACFLGHPQRPSALAEGGVLAYIVSDTFMSIKTHRLLREQMLCHRVHKMIRVAGDTFKAVVNCAVILCQRGAPPPEHTCQMGDLTNVSIHGQYELFLRLLHQTEGTEAISCRPNVANRNYALYHYRQSLIRTNSNLPFFVASPRLFALMNDTTSVVRHEIIGGNRVPVRTVQFNGRDVRLAKLGDIAEVKVGLQTGDNRAYLYQRPVAHGSYKSVEDYTAFLLTEADLEMMRTNQELRADVTQRGISKDETNSPRYFGGRYLVPYDKGGESASDEGWMPNYWVPTDYFIDWSEWAVSRMKTLTLREKNRAGGKPGGEDKLTSRFQNTQFYFQRGITFSYTGFYAPNFRASSGAVFDVGGSSCFAFGFRTEELLPLLANKFVRYAAKAFIDHTVNFQIDEFKELPVVIVDPARLESIARLTATIMARQKNTPRYDYASNEQLEIDRVIYEACGFNAAEIREVEHWYARRYPRLAQAQREGLAVLSAQCSDSERTSRLLLSTDY